MDDSTALYAKIQELVKNEARQQAVEVFNTLGTQFDVGKIPADPHNGTASSQIPISSILESIPINGFSGNCTINGFNDEASCVGAGGTWREGGVFNTVQLDTQKVNNEYSSGKRNPATSYILPINIIYGFGPGVHGAFNGGNAEPGTMVFFENGLILSSLWIKTINGWYGISPDLKA